MRYLTSSTMRNVDFPARTLPVLREGRICRRLRRRARYNRPGAMSRRAIWNSAGSVRHVRTSACSVAATVRSTARLPRKFRSLLSLFLEMSAFAFSEGKELQECPPPDFR